MSHVVRRFKELNLKLLSKKEIVGAHAGKIYKVEALRDSENARLRYIYKEFAHGRNKEVEIHMDLADRVKPFSRVVNVWDGPPQAMLMWDLGSPVKEGFYALSAEEKKVMIGDVLTRLALLHNMCPSQDKLPIHRVSSEWWDWCLDQLRRLSSRKSWALPGWEKTIREAYEQLNIPYYQTKCPAVITHGVPHLENVFYKDDEIWFIDWEWAAMGSPLRDVKILMQDLYDNDLVSFVPTFYRECLRERGIDLTDDDFWSDWGYLYIDHLTMMLAWEVEKYFQGYVSDEEIQKIIDWKIGEIERVTEMLETKGWK